MEPFNPKELNAVADIRQLIEKFQLDLDAANPHDTKDIVVRNRHDIVVQTRTVKSNLTTHTDALEREIARVVNVYYGWISAAEEAGKKNAG